MLKNFLFALLTTSLTAFISSCHAQKTSTAEIQNMKLGNTWVLEGFFDQDGKLVIDPSGSAELTISPDEKLFTGNTGCNAMRGPVKKEPNGKIKIGPVESMRKRCVNTETEKKLLEALECVTDYKIEGAVLKLYCNEKPVAQFESYRN